MIARDLDDDVKSQILDLQERAAKLGKPMRWLLPVCAVLTGGSILALGGQGLVDVNAAPSSIDIPINVLQAFSDSVVAVASDGSAAEVFGRIIRTLAIGGACATLGWSAWSLVKGRYQLAGRVLVLIPVIGFAAIFGAGIGNANLFPTPSPKSDLAEFKEAVQAHDYKAVSSSLYWKDLRDTPQGQYVLAQIVLADKWAAGRVQVNDALVARITDPAAGFKPSSAALYGLERAAYGKARSPEALEHIEHVGQRNASMQTLGEVSGVLGFIVGMGAVGLASMRRLISDRLRRINGLLGTEPTQ
ncbi:hypothetical protein ACN99C_26870 (plasmid) [Pseudomonas alloputida]|uniref:hypothetical protein n=1 Tax=Pseudomonas alloputida TaxID=1940621 RepID=UPI003B43640B